jgi:hypothetical protein
MIKPDPCATSSPPAPTINTIDERLSRKTVAGVCGVLCCAIAEEMAAKRIPKHVTCERMPRRQVASNVRKLENSGLTLTFGIGFPCPTVSVLILPRYYRGFGFWILERNQL